MDSFLCKTLIDIIKTSANVLPTFDFEEFDDVTMCSKGEKFFLTILDIYY